jgi:hypothetical protein
LPDIICQLYQFKNVLAYSRSFVLVSVMFGYDTTPNFVAGVAVAQVSAE